MLTSRKPKNIKYHNQRLILALLRSREVMTAGELAEQAHLSSTHHNQDTCRAPGKRAGKKHGERKFHGGGRARSPSCLP